MDARIAKVRALGKGTNSDAKVCHTIKTPNAEALFHAFKELASDGRVVDLNLFGGKLVRDNDNAAVIQLLKKANRQKFAGVFDDDELGDDDELIRGLDGLVIKDE